MEDKNGHYIAEHRALQLYEAIVQQSPQAICLLMGEALNITMANDLILQLWGKTRAVMNLPIMESLPELRGQIVESLLLDVFHSGKPYFGKSLLVKLYRNNELQDAYFDFSYSRIVIDNNETSGNTYGVLVMASEVTEQYLSEKATADSEWLLKTLIAAAPAGIGLFMGRDLKVKLPNQTFIDIVGKGPDIEGKPLREVMPELTTGNQPFLKILDDVYTSGKMFQSFGARVDIVQHGVMTNNFYNITYTPLLDKEGKVFAILDIAVDVSGEVQLRKKLEETEAFLLGAIQLSELGTWSVNLQTRMVKYSETIAEWIGIPGDTISLDELLESTAPEDMQRMTNEMESLFHDDNIRIFEEEYTIINRETGRKRLIRAQGRLVSRENNVPLIFAGTARDITKERQITLALEHQVNDATLELASTVEELRATNEELSVSNDLLVRSNEDLLRFAHVASHDLREPLRKIKTFLSRVELKEGEPVTTETLHYLNRITAAADRMWDMIQGVLIYSTINTGEHIIEEVNLNDTVDAVIVDLELLIQHSQAEISVAKLPSVEGIGLLLHQLFYNLIANALKFMQVKKKPVIDINFVPKENDEEVDIIISDNGIGFDARFAEQIFESFTRLHSKDSFEGTGLGLSLCKRIVERHHGHIRAEGEPDIGSRFIISLPLVQPRPFL